MLTGQHKEVDEWEHWSDIDVCLFAACSRAPAQTTPAAPAQPVAPEPTTKADMLAALLEFNKLHKPATLTQFL